MTGGNLRSRVGLACLLVTFGMGACDVPGRSEATGAGGVPWDTAPAVVLTPELTLPARLEGDGSSRPMSITAFAADSAGRLYFADTYRMKVVALGPGGALLWQHPISVSPQGNSVAAMGVAGGTVVYVDRLAQQVVFLDRTTGQSLGSVHEAAMSTAPFKNGQPIRVGRDGSVLFGLGNILPEPDPKYRQVPGTMEFLALVKGPAASETEQRLELPRHTGILVPLVGASGDGWGYRPPLVPKMVWTPNPFGGWTGSDSYSYLISVVDSAGAPLSELTRAVGPRRPSDDARRRELEFLESLARSYPQVRARSLVADTIGHFSSMAYSVDGRELWVGRTHLEADPTYDIWRDGRYTCSVTLDMGGKAGMSLRTPPFIVGGHLYHLAESEDYKDPQVRVFDVDHACGGGDPAPDTSL